MINEREADRAIAKMVRETAENRLVWQRVKPSGTMDQMSEDTVGWAYVTTFLEWRIGIFEISERQYNPDNDSFFFVPTPVAALIHDNNQIAFVFPHTAATRHLLQAAQAQAANARGFLDALLKE